MSSLFNQASLVVEPAVYETSKVYATKPFDGSGDLSFTRTGDTATRVNSAGLIEKVRTNLFYPSSMTSNITLDGLTRTAGQADPFGGSDAVKFSATATTGNHRWYNLSFPPSTSAHTMSIYVKADGVNTFALYGGGGVTYVIWDLSTQSVLSSNGNPLRSLVSIGDGWFRASMTFTGGAWCGFYLTNGTTVSWTGDGTSGMYAAGLQIEETDFGPTDYIATTSAAVSVGPVANVPRLDYLNSSCPRLLLEPQRQNALLQSESLDSATWTKDGGSVTANAVASPDGYTNADLFTEDTSNGNHRVYQSPISTSANQPLTFSVFAKYNGRQYVYLRVDVVSNKTAVFDIQNGTAGAVSSGASSKIENYGNGWYRLILTVDALAGNAAVCEGLIGFLSGSSFSSAVYTGNGTAGAYLWGFQGEANASYATSYIPTLGAAVTRGADACSKTGISSLIGSTEGVLYAEVDVKLLQQAGRILLDVNDNDTTNRALLVLSGSAVQGFVQGSTRVSYTLPSAGIYKFAFAYKSGDFALYVNGVQRSVSTDVVTFSGMNQLFLGHTFNINNTQPVDGIKSALLFKTRLSNSELAALTA